MRVAFRVAGYGCFLAALCLALVPAPAFAQAAAAEVLSAVVRVKAKILPDARTASILGKEREGAGVLVRDGYVLTIGYLILEADSVEITSAGGETVPASVAGYDHASGFGVLKLAGPIRGTPLPLGDPAGLAVRDPVMVASSGGREGVNVVYVVSRRAFSGSWEYLLDSAIFTYPPVGDWSGAALIGRDGTLMGIGSLVVADAAEPGTQSPGNLFVPVDLLKPILEDLIRDGRAAGAARPWLGVNTEELRGRVFVARVSPEGPAARAGLEPGDLVVSLAGQPVGSQADFYRKLWSRGAAGVEVPLRVLRGAELRDLTVRSIDRLEWFRRKPVY